MNSWNDYHGGGMPNMMNVPPLIPPMCLLNQINPAPSVGPPLPDGAPGPDNNTAEDMVMSEDQPGGIDSQDRGRDRSNYKNRKDYNSRDRSNRGNNRDRHDGRSDRDRSDRDRSRSDNKSDSRGDTRGDNRSDNRVDNRAENRNRRERRTKWSSEKAPGLLGHAPDASLLGNPMMPGMGGAYNSNNMNPMMGAGMDMANMPNMPGNMPNMPGNMPNMQGNMPNMQGNMPNMPGMPGNMQGMPGNMQGMPGNMQGMPGNMQGMPGNMSGMPGMQMPMMPGMNNMPNMMGNMMDGGMMDQNMMPMLNQPIFMSTAALLPPVPGVVMPERREKPPGCRTIFIGGLPNGVREDVINEIFSRFGNIADTKLHRQGICHLRFEKHDSVERSFFISGFRFKLHEQSEHEATTLFVDYALNRDDQNEFEKRKRLREPTPPRIEPYSPNTLNALVEKIKTDEQFGEAAPTLAAWLERGECNKRNANTFYSLIQASNNQVRRLFNEKMALDEEYHNLKTSFRDKFAKVVAQFEQVAHILTAAKHQRVSDHFTKQQRRNIEMWLKMTEELENIKEEFNTLFDEDEMDKIGKNVVPADKYEQLKAEHDTLVYELEGYKNEAFQARDEAERKFEKFKAHFIAQQALQNKQMPVYPPLPPPPPLPSTPAAPAPPPPAPPAAVASGEARLISLMTAFLMAHPRGASPEYLVSYVSSLVPNVSQSVVLNCLQKHKDVFSCRTSGIGATIEHRWHFISFEMMKSEY